MQKIAVIDYGMGNLRSVSKAIEHVSSSNDQVVVTSDATEIMNADRVVCPGQGAARDCMFQLKQYGVDQAVVDFIRQGRPFLGICMGLQVLFAHSDENSGTDCLGVIDGNVCSLVESLTGNLIDTETGQRLKVPHMGWSKVKHSQSHELWNGIDDLARFYFAHSYYIEPEDSSIIVGECDYGLRFATAVSRENIFACQFHPEKSATDGLRLLSNFVQWSV